MDASLVSQSTIFFIWLLNKLEYIKNGQWLWYKWVSINLSNTVNIDTSNHSILNFFCIFCFLFVCNNSSRWCRQAGGRKCVHKFACHVLDIRSLSVCILINTYTSTMVDNWSRSFANLTICRHNVASLTQIVRAFRLN